MQVKDLQRLLYKLDDDAEVVLLNDAAPLHATNAITGTVLTSEPYTTEQLKLDADAKDEVTFKDKLILTYNTRQKDDEADKKGDRNTWK